MTTMHQVLLGDARNMAAIENNSIHLVVTSPPYWTLKKYAENPNQLGAIQNYNEFLSELDNVWRECLRVLAPGGRLCIVVGDVCLSRRKHGRHRVVPLHADITTRCVSIGFDNLTPIFWYKIANIQTEMDRPGYFLGKPYEPNGVIKNDIEYILLLRKPGEYRHPTDEQREDSRIDKAVYHSWYRQIWDDVGGASTQDHPAPFPMEIADRLIRMFSFAGDAVLDPFLGTGTTIIAAIDAGRNSVGIEIDPDYVELASKRIRKHQLPSATEVRILNQDGAIETFTASTLLETPTLAYRPKKRNSLRAKRVKRVPQKQDSSVKTELLPILWADSEAEVAALHRSAKLG